MNYYIDFDYTLFDSYKFRQELYAILEKNGLDRSVLKLSPETKVTGQKLLNIRNVFKSLSEENNIPLENFIEPLEKIYAKCEDYLYEDSMEFLSYLKSKGNKLHLLTWGDKEFQSEKVKHSKIDNLFDKMYFTEDLKFTLEDIDYTNGVFVDDSIRDLEGLYSKNPKKVIRIRRENGKNSKDELKIKDILEYSSLGELQKDLENII